MKKNETSSAVANLISNKVAEQLQGIQEETKKVTKKAKAKKETKSLEEKKEKPVAKAKLVEIEPKAKSTKSKKEQVIQEVREQQKPSIIEKVISNREVKYVYPADIVDTLARKKWRQQTRNELHRLEREMFRIKDQNSKEFKAAAKKYEDFKNSVLKPEQVA